MCMCAYIDVGTHGCQRRASYALVQAVCEALTYVFLKWSEHC